ncbi:MAG: hypothetical protein N2255_00300, partial [Kiritimatiellae bacterium]|nr:hypothetical protein [Kiritimatiellia bacterium]
NEIVHYAVPICRVPEVHNRVFTRYPPRRPECELPAPVRYEPPAVMSRRSEATHQVVRQLVSGSGTGCYPPQAQNPVPFSSGGGASRSARIEATVRSTISVTPGAATGSGATVSNSGGMASGEAASQRLQKVREIMGTKF